MDNLYELMPGIKLTPAFESLKKYEKWKQNFAESIKPAIELSRIAHLRSIETSLYHMVD